MRCIAEMGNFKWLLGLHHTSECHMTVIFLWLQLVLDGRGVKVAGFEKGNFVGPTILSEVQVRLYMPVLHCTQDNYCLSFATDNMPHYCEDLILGVPGKMFQLVKLAILCHEMIVGVNDS